MSRPGQSAQDLSLSVLTRTTYSARVMPDSEDAQTGLIVVIADGHCALAAPLLPSDIVTAVAWLSVSVRCTTTDPTLLSRGQLAVAQCSHDQ